METNRSDMGRPQAETRVLEMEPHLHRPRASAITLSLLVPCHAGIAPSLAGRGIV